MKIVPTAILLITTLLIVPLFTFYTGTALGPSARQCLFVVSALAGFVAIYCFVVGEITQNNSQVDKLWSLVPIAYAWIAASYGDYSPRLVVMSLLVTCWGLRLSYNFSLKGAYRLKFWEGAEDYRWVYLRGKKEFQPKWKWTAFNLLFISGYQNALILLFTLPIIVSLQFNDQAFGPFDVTVASLMLFFILYEAVADAQHWRYQTRKSASINSGEELSGDYEKGFLDRGLWAHSRHPNYFAEQAIWVCFYFFSVSASGQWLNWSIAGCLLLIILFIGSSTFSEEISLSKYPAYAAYQKRVPRFVPIGKWT